MTIIYPEKCAYDTISRNIENNFHNYINKSKEEIKTIVIVGGYVCSEAETYLHNYPNTILHIFEPVLEFFEHLVLKYGNNRRCILYNSAVANITGKIKFYRTSSPGSDSIFPTIPNNNSGYTFNTIGIQEVNCVKLSDIFDENKVIDLLQIDAQGAELEVLKGTNLKNIKSLFLEIQMMENKDNIVYEGQCFSDDLVEYLGKFDIKLHSLGLDNDLKNGTGNSFWV